MYHHQTLASYLPEAMLIKIASKSAILDSTGELIKSNDPLPYFFHEYCHYLHNVSTVSGIAAFINTIELWRRFRETIDPTGVSPVSNGFAENRKEHLRTLISYLSAARRENKPVTNIDYPEHLRISSVRCEPHVVDSSQVLLSVLNCDAEVSDRGNREPHIIRVGTLELLEGTAWMLEAQMAKALAVTVEPPPVFPYEVVESVIEHALPGLSANAVICCILSALQSSDAPDGLQQVLEIARQANCSGDDLITILRRNTMDVLQNNWSSLQKMFDGLEAEFSGDGILAVSIRRIVSTMREAFLARLRDPFFELQLIEDAKAGRDAFWASVRKIAPCAFLQRNAGFDDDIGRDILGSFLPAAKPNEIDPEEGLRIVHSLFHFVGCHPTQDGFVEHQNARQSPCPFYTCCNLKLRTSEPKICKQTPWASADWSGWQGEKGACWYATGVRLTRPPLV